VLYLNFKIEVRTLSNDIPLIELEGEVDNYTSPKLKLEIINLLANNNTFIVDLKKIDYLDETAINLLKAGLKECRKKKGNMPLICPKARIKRVFEITGLNKVFDIYDSEKEVLEAIAEDPKTPT
jgi:anti-sigma B factor antagonist